MLFWNINFCCILLQMCCNCLARTVRCWHVQRDIFEIWSSPKWPLCWNRALESPHSPFLLWFLFRIFFWGGGLRKWLCRLDDNWLERTLKMCTVRKVKNNKAAGCCRQKFLAAAGPFWQGLSGRAGLALNCLWMTTTKTGGKYAKADPCKVEHLHLQTKGTHIGWQGMDTDWSRGVETTGAPGISQSGHSCKKGLSWRA